MATSRINFRLLARDALTHEKRLSIVAGDPATRALAASAGLPVFAYGRRVRDVARRPRGRAIETGGWAGAAAAAAAAAMTAAAAEHDEAPGCGTLGLVAPAAAAAAAAAAATCARRRCRSGADAVRARRARSGRRSHARPRRPRRAAAATSGRPAPRRLRPRAVRGAWRSIRTPWLIGGGILALALLVGAVGAYLLLPSATIVVTPRPEPVGPIQITVVADPTSHRPGCDRFGRSRRSS